MDIINEGPRKMGPARRNKFWTLSIYLCVFGLLHGCDSTLGETTETTRIQTTPSHDSTTAGNACDRICPKFQHNGLCPSKCPSGFLPVRNPDFNESLCSSESTQPTTSESITTSTDEAKTTSTLFNTSPDSTTMTHSTTEYTSPFSTPGDIEESYDAENNATNTEINSEFICEETIPPYSLFIVLGSVIILLLIVIVIVICWARKRRSYLVKKKEGKRMPPSVEDLRNIEHAPPAVSSIVDYTQKDLPVFDEGIHTNPSHGQEHAGEVEETEQPKYLSLKEGEVPLYENVLRMMDDKTQIGVPNPALSPYTQPVSHEGLHGEIGEGEDSDASSTNSYDYPDIMRENFSPFGANSRDHVRPRSKPRKAKKKEIEVDPRGSLPLPPDPHTACMYAPMYEERNMIQGIDIRHQEPSTHYDHPITIHQPPTSTSSDDIPYNQHEGISDHNYYNLGSIQSPRRKDSGVEYVEHSPAAAPRKLKNRSPQGGSSEASHHSSPYITNMASLVGTRAGASDQVEYMDMKGSGQSTPGHSPRVPQSPRVQQGERYYQNVDAYI